MGFGAVGVIAAMADNAQGQTPEEPPMGTVGQAPGRAGEGFRRAAG
jgi:hypothetical protein